LSVARADPAVVVMVIGRLLLHFSRTTTTTTKTTGSGFGKKKLEMDGRVWRKRFETGERMVVVIEKGRRKVDVAFVKGIVI
jgi:hypothetical protein